MKIQTDPSVQRWTVPEIQAALNALAQADDPILDHLQNQQAYLLLPDTELSLEVRHMINQLRNTGHLEQIANCFEKIPFSRVGQAWEGYCMYATSLFVALSLLKFTTRCYNGRLRCALFVAQSSQIPFSFAFATLPETLGEVA
jgi:hypothetical protein